VLNFDFFDPLERSNFYPSASGLLYWWRGSPKKAIARRFETSSVLWTVCSSRLLWQSITLEATTVGDPHASVHSSSELSVIWNECIMMQLPSTYHSNLLLMPHNVRRKQSTFCKHYGSGRKRLSNFMRCKATEHSVSMRLSSALLSTFLHGAGLGHHKDFSNNDNQPSEVQWFIYVPWNLTLNSSTFWPHSCIYVFCVDLRTNSDYFPIQHWLTGFYNRDGECLLCGTG